MAGTREFNFIVGPETSTQPSVGTPTADDDLITRGYADGRYLLGSQSINKLGDAGYTITDSDGYDVIMVGQSANMTAGRTVTLPTAADNDERRIRIVKADATTFAVTVDGEGSEVVGKSGQLTQELVKAGEFIHVICDGTKWHIIGRGLESFSGIKDAGDANYTVLDTDGFDVILYDTTLTADRTVTLPTVADNKGRRLSIKRAADGDFDLIVDGEGAETIDGTTTKVIRPGYGSLELISDGTAWYSLTQPIKWQRKALGSDVTTNTTILEFTGLTVGRTYRYTGTIIASMGGTDDLIFATITEGSTSKQRINLGQGSASNDSDAGSFNYIFVASDTSVKVVLTDVSGATVSGTSASIDYTYANLEELSTHENVSIW